MKEVFTCQNRAEAEVIKSKLDAFGVQAVIRSDDEGGFHPGLAFTQGVRLYVAEEDFVRAKEIIESN